MVISPYVTPKEAARLLRVSVRTVRRWVTDGQLAAVRIGRQWRIPQAALERMAQAISADHNKLPETDWLMACRQARAATGPGSDSTPLLRALREERAAQ